MDKISVSIESCLNEILLGIYFLDYEAQNLKTGETETGSMLSIGFILFSFNIFFKS